MAQNRIVLLFFVLAMACLGCQPERSYSRERATSPCQMWEETDTVILGLVEEVSEVRFYDLPTYKGYPASSARVKVYDVAKGSLESGVSADILVGWGAAPELRGSTGVLWLLKSGKYLGMSGESRFSRLDGDHYVGPNGEKLAWDAIKNRALDKCNSAMNFEK